MEQFLQNLTSLVSSANGFIWGVYFLIPLLCGTGLFFTIRLGGVQFTKFGAGLSGTVAKILKDYNKGLPYDASQYK